MTDKEKMAMFLSTLTDDQKTSLKLALETTEEVETPKKRTQTRRKKVKEEEPEPRQKSRRRVQKIDMDFEGGEEVDTKPAKSRRGKPTNEPRKKACRVEPLQTGKKAPDFAQDPDFDVDRHLTKADMKHWKGKRPKPSSRARVGMVEVTCIRCRRTYEVGGALAHKRFVCDRCITRE
jgi:hypothetical protein